MEDVNDVINVMNRYLEKFNKNNKPGFIPFMKTYLFVTENVKKRKKIFSDYKSMEKLDILFAEKFFLPLEIYLKRKRKFSPWKNYFRYCEKDEIPMLQILIGINSHINSDLAITLAELNYRNKKDFVLINDVLKETVPSLIKFLAFEERDLFGLGGLFFEDFFNFEFHKIIVRWRNQAWRNSLILRKNPGKRKVLFSKTEELSKDLIKLFSIKNYVNPKDFVKKLNSLSVKID